MNSADLIASAHKRAKALPSVRDPQMRAAVVHRICFELRAALNAATIKGRRK